jgi:hypothetical protein
MASEGRGTVYKTKDSKFFIYLPKGLCEDSMFPWKVKDSIRVKVSFEVGSKNARLIVQEWKDE